MSNFAAYSVGQYRDGGAFFGQPEPGHHLVSVHDGDVTTYVYALPIDTAESEFAAWVEATFEGDDGDCRARIHRGA